MANKAHQGKVCTQSSIYEYESEHMNLPTDKIAYRREENDYAEVNLHSKMGRKSANELPVSIKIDL